MRLLRVTINYNPQKMSKVRNISGFPEWLPEEKLLEETLIERIRGVFRSFGFVPIETPAVELISTLTSKGVVDKEIYALKRLAEQESGDEELALHFDLTVPFARYVASHFNDLKFPFKRYQVQKVWRGERPQKGRFREFYQFDVDIIGRETLPATADAEVIAAIDSAFLAIGAAKHIVRINNRKILSGIYSSFGIAPEAIAGVIRTVDKLDKIGAAGIEKELLSNKLEQGVVKKIVALTEIRGALSEASGLLSGFSSNAELESGREEISKLVAGMLPDVAKRSRFDLSLARGLDYYTGTIFEIVLPDYPEAGTVSSGGRYDNLASQFINRRLPGVGGSIGLTRLVDLILRHKLLPADVRSPTVVLVSVPSETTRPRALAITDEIRQCGLAAETFLGAGNLGKQIDYADTRGIPVVLFIDETTGALSAKNLKTKEQIPVENLSTWAGSLTR